MCLDLPYESSDMSEARRSVQRLSTQDWGDRTVTGTARAWHGCWVMPWDESSPKKLQKSQVITAVFSRNHRCFLFIWEWNFAITDWYEEKPEGVNWDHQSEELFWTVFWGQVDHMGNHQPWSNGAKKLDSSGDLWRYGLASAEFKPRVH